MVITKFYYLIFSRVIWNRVNNLTSKIFTRDIKTSTLNLVLISFEISN